MIPLDADAGLLSQHVDGVEVTCSVIRVPLLAPPHADELAAKLDRLQRGARARRPSAPVRSGWTWGPTDEDVVALPSGVRPGQRYCLRSSDWLVFIAPERSFAPRITVQLLSAYLLRLGPVVAYEQARQWVEQHLVPLIGGRPPEDEPLWRISRLDLAADVCGIQISLDNLDDFTTRASRRQTYTSKKDKR